jgi:hypothetical protein
MLTTEPPPNEICGYQSRIGYVVLLSQTTARERALEHERVEPAR